MDENTARKAARAWVEVAPYVPDDPHRLNSVQSGANIARTVVMRQAAAMIPDGAVVAAVDDDGKNPLLAAVERDGQALYVIDFVPFAEGIDTRFVRDEEIRASARIIGLDPARSRVEAISYWTKDIALVPVTRWRFELGGEELIFTTRIDPEEPLPQADRFAHALCSALGCALPPHPAELVRAA
jgi:hypothetical protein